MRSTNDCRPPSLVQRTGRALRPRMASPDSRCARSPRACPPPRRAPEQLLWRTRCGKDLARGAPKSPLKPRHSCCDWPGGATQLLLRRNQSPRPSDSGRSSDPAKRRLSAINGHRRQAASWPPTATTGGSLAWIGARAASASGALQKSYCCRRSKHLAAVIHSRRKRTWSRNALTRESVPADPRRYCSDSVVCWRRPPTAD